MTNTAGLVDEMLTSLRDQEADVDKKTQVGKYTNNDITHLGMYSFQKKLSLIVFKLKRIFGNNYISVLHERFNSE